VLQPGQADAFGLDGLDHVAERGDRGVAEVARLDAVHVHRLDAAAQLQAVEVAEAAGVAGAEAVDDLGRGQCFVVAGVVEQAGGDIDGVAEVVARHLDDFAMGQSGLQPQCAKQWPAAALAARADAFERLLHLARGADGR